MGRVTKRLLALCRPQGFLYGVGAPWQFDSDEQRRSLHSDGYAENTWLDGPIGSGARLLGLLPFVMFGYATGHVLTLVWGAAGSPALAFWLIGLAFLGLPPLFASFLYVSWICGPVVVLRDWGLVVGSAGEGMHDVPWERVVRWRRSVQFGVPSHVIDLGPMSPLASRHVVVSGGWTFRRA